MDEELLAAAGPLREAYAAVDWASTALGPTVGWDEQLLSLWRLALATPSPVCLFWGQDLTLLYNQAYVETIGSKHPGALGRPARAVFPEAWEVIGPMFASAMAGVGTRAVDQRVLLERRGRALEAFFTFSCSPVTDATGQVLGVFNVAVEATEQVVDRRRLELLALLNLTLADLLVPEDLAARALVVLRSAPLDLPAVDLVTVPHSGLGSATGSGGDLDGLRGLHVPSLDDSGFATRTTPLGQVAWVRLPVARPGSRPVVLVVQVPATTQLDGAYRTFVDLLAASLAAALDRAQVHVAEQATHEVTRSMSEALQRSMLTDLPHPNHLQWHARYVPAADTAQIGGDWYDAVVLPDGATTLVIGDVVGHDSRAAAAMGQLRAMTRTLAWSFEEPPSEVLDRLDRAMGDLQPDTLATVLLGRIEQPPADEATGMRRLRWTSAGHLSPLLVHPDGTAQYLPGRSDLLLGLHTGAPRHNYVAPLPPGSTLLLFTDGLVEHRDESLTTTLETLRAAAGACVQLELTAMVDALITTMTTGHRGTHGGRNDDDLAVLAVRMHPEDRPRPPEAGPSHH